MATIARLCEQKVLVKIGLRLSRREFTERELYGFPACLDWLKGDLQKLEPLEKGNLMPREQFLVLLRDFITGKPMSRSRMYRRMTPLENDVFELKTDDIRVFGWFQQRGRFIAVAANGIEPIKTYNLYPGYIGEVVRARDALDLDDPKCLWGAGEDDVL